MSCEKIALNDRTFNQNIFGIFFNTELLNLQETLGSALFNPSAFIS